MKLYTKTGDKGHTTLYDLKRVSKNHTYLRALGDIDELSAVVGMLCVKMEHRMPTTFLRHLQAKLIDLGSVIATTKKDMNGIIETEDIHNVELEIDLCESNNTTLKDFIIPGVNELDALAHMCRAITRRAERSMWELHFNYRELPSSSLIYVNRLSDYFFALARNLSDRKDLLKRYYINLNK